MSGWTFAWILWGFLFLAIELPAALNKTPGDTLSEHVWRLASVRDKAPWWRVRRAVLALALVVLLYHFLNGGGWLLF